MPNRNSDAYRPKVFVGVSRRDEEATPTKEASLEEAMDDAWVQAKDSGVEPGTRMRVLDIEFYGSNPIDMYLVVARVDG